MECFLLSSVTRITWTVADITGMKLECALHTMCFLDAMRSMFLLHCGKQS